MAGQRYTNSVDIHIIFLDYYKSLLGSDMRRRDSILLDILQVGPKVRYKDSIQLLQPVFEDEIREAMFSIDNGKAPGPDGFGSSFFKSCWPCVKEDKVGAV